MNEKNFAIVFRGVPQHKQKAEDFLDSIGATVIFVKQADVNRKLVVKNLPAWEDEKQDESTDSP
ncbi:MAG TPA: hypothetical protein VK536_05420 [Candidatus Limnocylindrales bacterium]|nr:hypothetical protein [Candidatus Limnocylindrales bacterium]